MRIFQRVQTINGLGVPVRKHLNCRLNGSIVDVGIHSGRRENIVHACPGHHRLCRSIVCAFTIGLLLIGMGAGCIDSGGGSGNASAFSDLLGGLGSGATTSSDNNDNEPTGGASDGSGSDNPIQAEVLKLVNERRGLGANCGTAGSFDEAGPLVSNAVLTDIAQAHSEDMSQRNFFDHVNPDGDGPGERIEASTYEWSTWGENIASGYRTPQEVVDGWMSSDGHCANIMNPAFTEIGVGYEPNGSYWTQVFGAPR